MQIKLPEEDEQQSLYQEIHSKKIHIQPPKQPQAPKNTLKVAVYVIVAIVVIAAYLMSSQKTVKVSYDDLEETQPVIKEKPQVKTSNNKQAKLEEINTISKGQAEDYDEFVVQKFGEEEQLKPVDWDKIKPQRIERPVVPKAEKENQKKIQQKIENTQANKDHEDKKTIEPLPPLPLVNTEKKQSQKSEQKKVSIEEVKREVQKKMKQEVNLKKDLATTTKDQKKEQKAEITNDAIDKGPQKQIDNIPKEKAKIKPKQENLPIDKLDSPKIINSQPPKSLNTENQNSKTQLEKVPKQPIQNSKKSSKDALIPPKQPQINKDIKQKAHEGQKKVNNEIKKKQALQIKQKISLGDQQLSIKNKEAQIQQFKQTLNKGIINPFISAKFSIPKNIWTFAQDSQQSTFSFYLRKCIQNHKYFAQQSDFQYSIISSNNYVKFLSSQSLKKIQFTLSTLSTRQLKEPQGNLKDHFSTIKRRLISLHILNENGGIFIENNILLTENFNWISDIAQNIFVNKGNGRATPKYVAFFDIDHGTILQKHNKSNIVYDTERYMVQFPGIEPYFLAAIPNGPFLTQTLIQYVQILQKPQTLGQKLKKYELKMGTLQGKDLYYQVLYISQHIVLQRKQKQIDTSENNKYDNNFAIDYYGLFTINERYFPKKMQFTFQNNHQQKVYWNLARYTLHELQQTTGPLRYFVSMMFESHINYRLQKAINHQSRYYIHPQSILGKYLINDNSQPYILTELEKSVVNKKGNLWEKLPKIIWIYWDTGIENSTVGNQLCVENIKRFANYSKYEVREINNSNTEKHIGKFLNDKIDNFIKNKKIMTYAQTKSDFVRIALIARYGGIYLDASYFSVEFLDWIKQISWYPSEFIFNRYGELPRVFLHFHPHFGQPFDWTYDKEANTKHMWLSAYQNNILIAQPNQQLFWDWLEEYGRFITSPYEQTEELMKKYGVYGHRWTNKDNVYLAAMDSIKNVIGKKELQLTQKKKDNNYKGPKSAAQFYGIWSISGYRGQQKFRAHTNFDNTYHSKPHNSDNPFLWRYPQNYVSGIIGSPKHFVKLYGWNIKYLNTVLYESYNSRFQDQVHPISYFGKYLLFSYRDNIKIEDDKLVLIKPK